MRNGICPKCGADEVYKQEHYVIRIRRFLNVPRVIYACVACGYSEQYIEDSRIEEIRNHWQHVQARRKRKNDDD